MQQEHKTCLSEAYAALIDWDAAVLRLQVAKQEPSDFDKKLGLEKTFSLYQAEDELKRCMARLKEAISNQADLCPAAVLDGRESARLGKRGGFHLGAL